MDFLAIKLEFTTPLHLGRGWGDLDHSEPILHSDTLKSAIYATLIQINPDWKKRAIEFFNGFKISSCFPFYKQEFFLPKLQLKRKFRFEGINEEKQAKTAKKVEYLSSKVFNKYINSDENDIIVINKNQLSNNNKYIFEKERKSDVTINQTQQRVTINYFEKSTPFFTDRIFFEKDAGLYFLTDFGSNNELRNDVFKAIKFLGTLGIGTDKTVGNGFFDFNENKHIAKLELDFHEHNALSCLGLYLPTENEINEIELNKSYWGLKERGGYMAGSEYLKFRHLLKAPVHMFTEGSVFHTNKKLSGTYKNLKPHWNDEDLHDVFRCGQPLFIPVKI